MKREITFILNNYDATPIQYTDAHPIYGNDFAINVGKESGQVFYREKLSDNLTFVAEDFSWIMSQPFDAIIYLTMFIYDGGTLTKSWFGKFSRTDCIINEIDKILKVKPETEDVYSDILDVLDAEFNLAELPIPNTLIQINVPPVIQIYKIGASDITNYWQGETWNTAVEPIRDINTLRDMCFVEFFVMQFYGECVIRILTASGGTQKADDSFNINNVTYKYATTYDSSMGYKIEYCNNNLSNTPTQYGQYYEDGVATGTYYLPPSDPNYIYLPFDRDVWGAWDVWGVRVSVSLWLAIDASKTTDVDNSLQIWRLYASYALGDLIRGLLAANNLNVNFLDSSVFSEFLYANPNPITSWAGGWHLNFTAKSNIIRLGSDSPASKVPCTLGTIFNFLKNALNVYWSIENIDGASILRLEHISYYKNGGNYSGTPITQYDLTTMINPRNGKPWAFGQYQYQFEKYQMPQFVKWEWMDESDELFDGTGFKCKSKYVQSGNTESITVANVTSNIVKMMMQPDQFSMDGLAVIWTAANDRTDYYYFTRNIGGNWRVPNGQLSMWYLQQSVLLYDAPCEVIEVSGTEHQNVDYKRTKYSEATFPADYADANQHIKTAIGDGAVDTLEINLVSHSIKAKLKYGNE